MASQQQFGLEIFELQSGTARVGRGQEIKVFVGLAIGGAGKDRLQPLGRGEIRDVRGREFGRLAPVSIESRVSLVVIYAQ
ncbi:MAG TPA: hypothetical protein VIF88_09340 [Methylocystis sp.]|jgi:hypothetical protein